MDYEKYLNHCINFGKVDFYRLAEEDGYGIKLSWRHGINTYFILGKVTREEVLTSNDSVPKLMSELLKIRDARIEQVIYWTNCTEIK